MDQKEERMADEQDRESNVQALQVTRGGRRAEGQMSHAVQGSGAAQYGDRTGPRCPRRAGWQCWKGGSQPGRPRRAYEACQPRWSR